MKCERCGSEIETVLVDTFNRDGSDSYVSLPLVECEEGAVHIDTTQNWTGYELTEDEMNETIQCPHCKYFPFKKPEIQIYDIVRVVCFKQEEKSKWKVTKNVTAYQVWRQIRPLEQGEPMHSGVRECRGWFATREEVQQYADELNKEEIKRCQNA